MALIPAQRIKEAAELLLAANTADWEDCDVCAVLEVECPYHQGRRDEHNELLKSDPITWDGTDETRHKLHLAIGDTWWLDPVGAGALYLVPKTDGGAHARITPGWRIQIIDNSFVILPPAKDGDA